MKKFILFILIFLFFSFQSTFADSPILLFSDMESAPNSGWSSSELNKWASVTIWWRNLWDTRWTSYITVNWVDLKSDSDYAVWWEYWPTPFYQKITFWLNDTMPDWPWEITVTINWEKSNPLPFTIRAWRIFFVSNGTNWDGSIDNPFKNYSLTKYWVLQPSLKEWDILYYRGWIYTQAQYGANSFIRINDPALNTSKDMPFSLIAYPWEKPLIQYYGNTFWSAFSMQTKYMIVSWFSTDRDYTSISMWDYWRAIWNDLIWLKKKSSWWTAIVTTSWDWNKIFWNAIHWWRSKWRLDHWTYFSWCSPVEWNYLGWNYVYDNDFWRWPELSVNHQQDRCAPDTEILKSHFIFSNIVDCSPQRATATNIYDLSYDPWELEPEPTFVYNNMFLNCGTLDTVNTSDVGWATATVASPGRGHSRFYNNLFYNTHYVGFGVSGWWLSTYFRNNILVMNSSWTFVWDNRQHRYIENWSYWNDNTVISDNLFYDIWDFTMNLTHSEPDKNMVWVNPLFNDPTNLDFNLQLSSPAINAWANDLILDVVFPSFAPITKDIFGRDRVDWLMDIWPFESPPVSCVTNSDCNDWLYCNWEESCISNICVWWAIPSSPDDWIICTVKECNEVTDSFDNIAKNYLCDDSNDSTNDICSPSIWCQNIPVDVPWWDSPPSSEPLPDNLVYREVNILWDAELSYANSTPLWDRKEVLITDWIYYRFDLSWLSLPANHEYYSARLKLYTTRQYWNVNLYTYWVDKPWLESWLTPTRYNSTNWWAWDNYLWDWIDKNWIKNWTWYFDITSLIDDDKSKYVYIDLTNIFWEFYSWSLSMDNWIFITQEMKNRHFVNAPKHFFRSKEHEDNIYHPKLELWFLDNTPVPESISEPIPAPDPTPLPDSTPTLDTTPISTPSTSWWWGGGWWWWGWWYTPVLQCKKEELKCKLVPWSTVLYKIYKIDWSFCQSDLLWETCRPDTFNIALEDIEEIEEIEDREEETREVEIEDIKYVSENKLINKLWEKIDKVATKKDKEMTWTLLENRNSLLRQLDNYIETLKSDLKPSIKRLKIKILKRNIINVFKNIIEELKN